MARWFFQRNLLVSHRGEEGLLSHRGEDVGISQAAQAVIVGAEVVAQHEVIDDSGLHVWQPAVKGPAPQMRLMSGDRPPGITHSHLTYHLEQKMKEAEKDVREVQARNQARLNIAARKEALCSRIGVLM